VLFITILKITVNMTGVTT